MQRLEAGATRYRCLGLAGLAGLYLVAVGGVAILVLGALAVLSALAYTGGPWPYGYLV